MLVFVLRLLVWDMWLVVFGLNLWIYIKHCTTCALSLSSFVVFVWDMIFCQRPCILFETIVFYDTEEKHILLASFLASFP